MSKDRKLGDRLEERLKRANPKPRIPTRPEEPTGPDDRGWTRDDVYRHPDRPERPERDDE